MLGLMISAVKVLELLLPPNPTHSVQDTSEYHNKLPFVIDKIRFKNGHSKGTLKEQLK